MARIKRCERETGSSHEHTSPPPPSIAVSGYDRAAQPTQKVPQKKEKRQYVPTTPAKPTMCCHSFDILVPPKGKSSCSSYAPTRLRDRDKKRQIEPKPEVRTSAMSEHLAGGMGGWTPTSHRCCRGGCARILVGCHSTAASYFVDHRIYGCRWWCRGSVCPVLFRYFWRWSSTAGGNMRRREPQVLIDCARDVYRCTSISRRVKYLRRLPD